MRVTSVSDSLGLYNLTESNFETNHTFFNLFNMITQSFTSVLTSYWCVRRCRYRLVDPAKKIIGACIVSGLHSSQSWAIVSGDKVRSAVLIPSTLSSQNSISCLAQTCIQSVYKYVFTVLPELKFFKSILFLERLLLAENTVHCTQWRLQISPGDLSGGSCFEILHPHWITIMFVCN